MRYIVNYVNQHDAMTRQIRNFSAESDVEALWKLAENLEDIFPTSRDILLSQSSGDPWTPENLKETWTTSGMTGEVYIISLKNKDTGKMILDNIWPYRQEETVDWPLKKKIPSAWEAGFYEN